MDRGGKDWKTFNREIHTVGIQSRIFFSNCQEYRDLQGLVSRRLPEISGQMKWSRQSHNFCNSVDIYIYLGILRYRPEQDSIFQRHRTIPIAKLREPWKSFLCLSLERYAPKSKRGGKKEYKLKGGRSGRQGNIFFFRRHDTARSKRPWRDLL